MTLIFSCIGQSLMRSDNNLIAENSFNYLKARFDLDESWKGLAVTACFKNKSTIINMALIDGECTVPWEVLKAGEFRVSLLGFIGDFEEPTIRATSNEVKVFVEAGPSLTGQNSAKPTPTDVEQITNLAQSAVDKADNAVETANSVREEADSGKFNAKISSVSAESIPHGTPASVTNVGTGTDAKLVFRIPDGKQGEPGKQGPAGDSFYAFYAEEEILSYINDKKPETFEVLWLGETTDETEFGSVYEFNIVYNDNLEPIEFDKVKKGSLRGPEGPAGKDGEVAAAFTDTSGIDAYIANYNVNRLSFIWAGTDDKTYSYTNKYGVSVNISLKKGDIYIFNINDKKVIGYTKGGNLKGSDGVGISRIERTSGNGAAGTTDAYTITLTNNTVGGTLYVYNGKDGADAELYGIKGYTVKSNADILNLCEKYPNSYFLVVNTGNTFTAITGTKNLVVNTGDICGVDVSTGVLVDIRYLDNSPISLEEATIYHWTEINEDNVGVDRYAAVINGNTDGGVASGSGEYELIKSLIVTETEFNAGMQGLVFNLDKDNNPFSLKAVTCICEFPPASKVARLSLDMMTSETSGSTIYRRGDILSTSETRYCRISARLEGYWIGESVHGASNSEAIVTYGTWARNKRSGKLSYIRLTSDVTLPVGTKIEVFGVRA